MFTLQTLPAIEDPFDQGLGQVAGFSLHAGVAAKANQRKKLERLWRYISRPAIAEKRLSLTSNGNVRYRLKTPCRDGTTHVIFEPLDRDASSSWHGWRHWPYAVRPKPRVNFTRFHDVFAPNSQHRAVVTRAGRGKQKRMCDAEEAPTLAERRASMNWAQRLKRVFDMDIDTCTECGGAMRVIVGMPHYSIEDPTVIRKILAYLNQKAGADQLDS